ncbi:mucin-13b [Parambassis ranga]|uniref:Mucin-13b n=1 Tax=Parambassis ranga TaxID=210632 RepID=A0A6P7K8R5_9TELE|nr:mucin-13-like [Parambassis ranga]
MAGKHVLQSVLWITVAIVLSAPLATASTAAPPTAGPSIAAPTTGPSSAAPTAGPSTAAPTAGPSTAAPTAGPSTAAPTAGPSTAAPTAGPSTAAPTAGPSTAAPTVGPSTAAPTAGPSTAAPTAGPSTAAPPPNPCDQNLCGQGSTCQPRANQSFVCVCLPGDNYNDVTKSCESAKVFPGQLGLPSIPYNKAMENTESPEFQHASNQITDALDVTFKNDTTGYAGSLVLELQLLDGARSEPGVRASVEMFFRANSAITTEDVSKTLTFASTTDGVLANSVFRKTDLCSRKPCDAETATCNSTDGTFTCTCDPNYVPTSFSNRMCIACPSGKKAVESECKECQFGYSGLNCSENWKLILVIVGSVLGGLLLIALILLPVLAKRSTKKSGKKVRSEDLGKPYMSHSPAKAPLANNGYPVSVSESGNGVAGFGVPKIPRATANNSWDSSTNLEMIPSNSRQNLMGKSSRLNDDDQDDFNPYSRSTNSLNFQVQPRSNPYAQNRPQSNPYAQSQGHSNPYYSQDEGRRF